MIIYVVLLSPPFFLEPKLVDELRQLYPGFNGIYESHIDDARFDGIKGHEFKSLKERLITMHHVLEKYPGLSPGKRTELIQDVLSEGNLRRARQHFPKPNKNNQSGKASSLWSAFTGLFSGSKEMNEESLRADVKKISSISDSDFLLQLKVVDDEELQVPIQTAVDLACSQLSSSIDTTVVKMTHAVLWMQEEECKRLTRLEIETERRNSLSGKLADFIRVINKVSHGRRTTYVSNYCRDP